MNARFVCFDEQIQFVPNATHPCDGTWQTGCGLNSSPMSTDYGCGRQGHPDSPMHRRMDMQANQTLTPRRCLSFCPARVF